MANDFGDVYDIENLDDGELRDLIYQQMAEVPEIDRDLVDVQVERGVVRLSGRVGTEQELQQAEHVVTELLGSERVNNELVIDELVRGERSQAADEAAAEDALVEPLTGAGEERTSDTASHLLEDARTEMYGTHDSQQAVSGGVSYEPPDRPVQEGTWSKENH